MYQSESAPWLWFRAWATDGSAKTDLVYNTSGISIKVARDNQADSSALTLSAASGPTDWAAGKFLQVVGNLYKVGIATASISSYTGVIAICGSYTGGTIEGVLDYVSAYDPTKNPLSPLVAGRQIAVAATTGAVELDSSVLTQLQSIEDGVDANTGYLTSVLAKIGSFTGTGVNNILGFLRAIFRSDASTPSDMGGTATAADHSLQAVRVRGDAAWITGSGGGTGARVVTVTVNDGTSPLQNAVVRMTEGSNSYTATTNASGVATFNLNDATYTVSIAKDGYSYAGTSLVVNGTETVTYSMTAISVTPSTGNFTTAYQTVFSREGVASAGVTVRLQIVRLGTSYSGAAYNGEIRTEVSGVDGVVQFLNVPKDSEILNWIGDKKAKSTTSIPSTAGSTYALPSIVSAP